MSNLDGFVIGTLEQIAVSIPEDELRRRFEVMGFPKENVDYIMECVNNSRKKYQEKINQRRRSLIDKVLY